jgi:hypothetical protein
MPSVSRRVLLAGLGSALAGCSALTSGRSNPSSESTPVARWHADAAWYVTFDRGDVSADELSLRVLATVEQE